MSSKACIQGSNGAATLKRTLTLWNLIFIGVVMIQPIAPMGVYGVISNRAHGHVITTILIAMVAMLFTAISYGKMARVYPSAGSAFTFVGRELHPSLGYVTGWCMLMDYILNPLVCVAMCSKLTMNILPFVNFYVLVIMYAALFTMLNLRGINTSAKVNEGICWVLCLVVLIFVAAVIRYIGGLHTYGPGFFTDPFYDPHTFNISNVFAGTSIAVLTYIGFDAISTLSEEAKEPTRDILKATVITCLVIGFLSAIEVYLAQLVWGAHGSQPFPADQVESAFVIISKQAGGVVLFQIINLSILVATLGSGMGAQLAAGRLLYGMGRGNALPKKFFGVIDPVNQVPKNGIITVGVIALIGVCVLEGLSKSLGGGAYEQGVQLLNFGALLGFVGVNAANVVHYWVKAQEKRLVNLLPGVIGFIVCAALWLSLGLVAKILGLIWLALGIVYGYTKTNGFRGNLITFE